MNQKDMILEYIRRRGSITGLEAVTELGVMKLSNRIGELENDGYLFDRKDESKRNKSGRKTSYKRYFLKQ